MLALLALMPKNTAGNDTIKTSMDDPELYLTQNRSITEVLLAENPLIECLIRYESGGNPNAVGDSGRAYGILQFWQSTFNLYAEEYGLEGLVYEDPESQIILAYEMLKRNPANVGNWTAAKYCD